MRQRQRRRRSWAAGRGGRGAGRGRLPGLRRRALLEIGLQLLQALVLGLLLVGLLGLQPLEPLRILLARVVREHQRGDHEEDRRDRRQAGEEVAGARRAEHGLAAAAAAEGDAHAAAFSGLQQHDEDQEHTDEDVDDGEKGIHGVEPSLTRRTNDSADSDAPPTRPPSTSASAIRARTLSGFMLPP